MRCRVLSESIKLRRSVQRRNGAGIPDRITCDKLLELYFATFDTVFRVLHVPTFYAEYNAYWDDANFKKKTFHQKLLLVLAIGTCFYYKPDEQKCPLRSLASAWIFQAQQWLVSVFEMGEPDMEVLQISCLLLLARQVDKSGSELAWISADFPLRIAISEGYHLEPSVHFPTIAPFEAEMRRRIWAAILELSLQSSLDANMPPPVSGDIWDCHPPANANDSDISETTNAPVHGRPSQHITQSSAQIMLIGTVRTRLKILQSLMTLAEPVDYREIADLVSELEKKCRTHVVLLGQVLETSPQGAASARFQLCLLEDLNRRLLLAVHHSSLKLKTSAAFLPLSNDEAIESSLRILKHDWVSSSSPAFPLQNVYSDCLQTFGGGIFKHTFWHAFALLCGELTHIAPNGEPDGAYSQALLVVQECMEILHRQKTAGDTDTENFMAFSLAHTQILGKSKKSTVSLKQKAQEGLEFCCHALRAELDANCDNPDDLG
jgi:hypothetical protein